MNAPHRSAEPCPRSTRWPGLDIARGVALLAMMVFHLSWDLSLFGLIETDVANAPAWRAFARTIAGSFLIMVGIGLVLAHVSGFRRAAFLRRLATVGAAALAVTVATWFVFPDSFIFFGILHAITVSSMLALPFLRAPTAVVLLGAITCLLAPALFRSPVFDGDALLWLGLGTTVRLTNDYEPILPWFGFVLGGVAAARLILPRLPALPDAVARSAPARLLAFAGRHSLLVYLVHQPILIGLVWLAAQAIGPLPRNAGGAFMPSCEASCRDAGQTADACVRICACTALRLQDDRLWDKAVRGQVSREESLLVGAVARQCLAAPD